MRCAWKVLAVCLLLQSVYAYLPVNNESLIPKGANILKKNAETLFGAIFNPTQRKKLSLTSTISQNVLEEVCGDLYAGQVESIMYVGGYDIRKCVRGNNFLLEIYMKRYGVEKLKQQFLEGIQLCSQDISTSSEIKCFSNLISKLFQELNYFSEGVRRSEQLCVQYKLEQTLRKLAKASTKYERCLCFNSSNNPTSPPETSSTWSPPSSTWASPNSTWTPPDSTLTLPSSTSSPPNSTWAPLNSTLTLTKSTSTSSERMPTWASPNSTLNPPSSTSSPTNSTWVPEWSTTIDENTTQV